MNDVCCDAPSTSRLETERCPACGGAGRPVARLTLGALLKPEARPRIPMQEAFCFCRTAACDVVYFRAGEALFRKADLSAPVGIKEPDNPHAPACYCFGWTPRTIRAEIETTGQSTVLERIKAQVKAGNCYCEVTNPQGACCLGNVAAAVKTALRLTDAP